MRRMCWKSGCGLWDGDSREIGFRGGSWGKCGIGSTPWSLDVEGELAGGVVDLVSASSFMDPNVFFVNCLSFSKSLIASASSSTRAFKSSMPFGAPLGRDLVRVGVVDNEHCERRRASDRRGEVWMPTEVERSW